MVAKYPLIRLLQIQSFLIPQRFQSITSISPTMNPDVKRIISFWFDRNPMDWFAPKEGFDDECNESFGDLIAKARANELDDWISEAEGSLALIVLLDQLPRNIFRGSPEAFSSDSKAADIATRAVALGFDKEVPPIQNSQFYLALMHQESLITQVAGLALYKNLAAENNGTDNSPFLERAIKAAKVHLEVIERFGRFPSRNAIIGRENTEAETEFLKEFPSGFRPLG